MLSRVLWAESQSSSSSKFVSPNHSQCIYDTGSQLLFLDRTKNRNAFRGIMSDKA